MVNFLFLNRGSERSIKTKKNILGMLFIKGGNIFIGFLLVPLTLGYVDSETYGLWITLSSMVAWIAFFDIGINNGLKNNLAKAIAEQDYNKAKTYISTTYAILCLIFIPLMVILLCVIPFIDWQSVLNIKSEHVDGLLSSISIIITYFCINFILNTINVVLLADQKPADASFRTFIQQIISLIIIFVLTKTTKGNLFNLCLALCGSPIFVVLLFNITLFKGRYKKIAPSFRYIDFHQAPTLMKLGVQFFIIQIAGIIQYQMINFLILRYFGANEVTAYNIGYKYFSILTMVWGILTTPLWVAFTDALTKKDIKWIRNIMHKYLFAFFTFCLIGVLMLLLADWVYKIWIGNSVIISFKLSLWILIYCVTTMFSNLYVSFINGSGELKIQTIACCFSPLVFLGVCFGLIHIGFGVSSMLIAAIVANFNGVILAPMQSYKIIKTYENNK